MNVFAEKEKNQWRIRFDSLGSPCNGVGVHLGGGSLCISHRD